MSINTVPVFGFGRAKRIPRRGEESLDLFESGPTDDELRNNFRIRCGAIQDYLAGRRADPDVTPIELSQASDLGADDFDRRFEQMR